MEDNGLMKKSRLLFLLIPMVVATPLAVDVNIPAFPSMSSVFGVNAGVMQLSLTFFMLAAGLMQLIIGPLSDQFGRKPILLLSALIFSLGIFFCATTHSIVYLLVFRVVEAMGACGLFVLSFAIVRDLFQGKESAECYAYLNGIVGFSSIIGPFIESMLDVYFGWPATFLFLFLVVFFVLFFTAIFLPETLQVGQRTLMKINLFKTYWGILRNTVFIRYTFVSAASFSYLYLFCSMSPYVIIRLLHIPETHYGYYFAFMGASLFVGSFVSSRVIDKIGVKPTCVLGCVMSLIGGSIMVGWYLITGLTISNFIWPMLMIGVGGSFSMGAAVGLSMEPFGDVSGAAAGLGGSLRLMFAAFLGSILITKNITSTLPLSLSAIGFSVIGLLMIRKI